MGNLHWLEGGFKIAEFTLGRDNGGGIDNDSEDVLVVVVGKAKKKEARLSGNGNADFVGKCKPATAFPIFFGNEYLDERSKMSTLGIIQYAVMSNVTLDDFFPRGRKWSFHQLFSATIG
jgi:hypothetical protein